MNLYCRKRQRLARYCSALAILSLAGGIGAAAASIGTGLPPFFVLAGLAGCVLNRRRATALNIRPLQDRRAFPSHFPSLSPAPRLPNNP